MPVARTYVSNKVSNKGYTEHCLDDFEQSNNTAMLVPNTNTRARCTGDDESAPKTRDLLTYLLTRRPGLPDLNVHLDELTLLVFVGARVSPPQP